ncbi:MAG: DUF349 domain-containing protein [Bacteroidales bacterium]|nr:DUF349 domain-containing protein [Bacteroidales bacterium]
MNMNTKEEVIERLKELMQQDTPIEKAELDSVKVAFYRIHNAETEAAKNAFVEAGGVADDFVPQPDEKEDEFKELLNAIKEIRSAQKEADDKEKQENLTKKLNIFDQMEALIANDDANAVYQQFKALQGEWLEIKNVPAENATSLWKTYQKLTEKFYDLLKLNNAFREYDFKKNLEIKTRICENAEKLAEDADVIGAFRKLQQLHQEFRDTGPVAREFREDIWNRFKAASTVVSRAYQQFFENRKEQEQNNYDQKVVICEIVEAIEYETLKTYQDWKNKTDEVLTLQAKWKKIGYAPLKLNSKIFERFRAACDDFFNKKAAFFKEMKGSLSENLEKKRHLCEQAEALKDSTDWKTTAETLSRLQKEWKEIGPVTRKHSEAIWKRFVEACDYFFEQKNKVNASQHSEEHENLEKKREIIRQLRDLNTSETPDGSAVHDLVKQWNTIGHVPFKEKDKLFKQYRAVADVLFDKLNSQKRHSNKGQLDSGRFSGTSHDRLVREYEVKKAEIQTYENNLGFLSKSSKNGGEFIQEISRKIDSLKNELAELARKIESSSLEDEK